MHGGSNNTQVTRGSGRLLGVVRVLIGGQAFELPVEAMAYERDGEHTVGGFFESEGQLGILVDDTGSAEFVQAQIDQGTVEAVRHLSRKFLN